MRSSVGGYVVRGLWAGCPARIGVRLVDIISAIICSGGSITGDCHGTACIDSPHARGVALAAHLSYGCGLRISEALFLLDADVDLADGYAVDRFEPLR